MPQTLNFFLFFARFARDLFTALFYGPKQNAKNYPPPVDEVHAPLGQILDPPLSMEISRCAETQHT